MEKTYSVENQVFSIVESALSLATKENSLKASKKEVRANAEALINHFISEGKIDSLPGFLSIQFEAMEAALMFGPTDVYVQGNTGQKVHTLKKLNGARTFQRAFKSIVTGFELKGMAPFKIVPIIPVVEQSNEDKLVEFCEGIKCDVVAINAIKDAFIESEKRTVLLRTEAEKRMQDKLKARKEQKAYETQQNAISAFLSSGLTVADIQKAMKESEADEVKQATK